MEMRMKMTKMHRRKMRQKGEKDGEVLGAEIDEVCIDLPRLISSKTNQNPPSVHGSP